MNLAFYMCEWVGYEWDAWAPVVWAHASDMTFVTIHGIRCERHLPLKTHTAAAFEGKTG